MARYKVSALLEEMHIRTIDAYAHQRDMSRSEAISLLLIAGFENIRRAEELKNVVTRNIDTLEKRMSAELKKMQRSQEIALKHIGEITAISKTHFGHALHLENDAVAAVAAKGVQHITTQLNHTKDA